MAKSKEWLDFEKLVAQLFQEVLPGSTVTHNVKIKGKESGQQRQIDALVEMPTPLGTFRIAVSVKRYKTKVDVTEVDSFVGTLQDIHINQGIIVSHLGFTSAAIESAKSRNIFLFENVSEIAGIDLTALIPATTKKRKYHLGFNINGEIQLPGPAKGPITFDTPLVKEGAKFLEIPEYFVAVYDSLDQTPNVLHHLRQLDGSCRVAGYTVPVKIDLEYKINEEYFVQYIKADVRALARTDRETAFANIILKGNSGNNKPITKEEFDAIDRSGLHVEIIEGDARPKLTTFAKN